MRPTLLLLSGIVIVACIVFIFWNSFTEENVDIWVNIRGLRFGSVKFRVLLYGLDTDLGKVRAHTQIDSDSFSPLMGCEKDLGPLEKVKDVQIFYAVPSLMDQTPIYEAVGLSGVYQNMDDPQYAAQKPYLSSKIPRPAEQELSVIGNPRWFPFDEYWVIATMQAGGYGVRKDKVCRLNTVYDLDVRFPGYIVREISGIRLLREGGKQSLAPNSSPAKYNAQFWFEKGIAISIERPMFIKVLAVLLLFLAFVSIPLVAFRSKAEDYLVNCVAYFLGLWAVRGILIVNAPKSPTIVDYVILMLYAFQILLVAYRALWHKFAVRRSMS